MTRALPLLTAITAITAIAATTQATPSPDDAGILWEALTPRGTWVAAQQTESGSIETVDGRDALGEAIAIRHHEERTGARLLKPFAALSLADGQKLSGSLIAFVENADGTAVRWKHPGLGIFDTPLEDVSYIQLEPTATIPVATDADRIVLRNGDQVSGFVERFENGLVLESGGVRREIALDLIATIALVHKDRPPGAFRVWLVDGSVVDGTSLRGGPGSSFVLDGLSVASVKPSVALLAEEVLAIARAPQRILPLASLVPEVTPSQAPSLPRAQLAPPEVTLRNAPLGAASITIRGPQRLIYEVPKGMTLLTMRCEIPASTMAWTNCVLVIRQAGRELSRTELSRTNSKVDLSVPVNFGKLEIELEEALGGSVGDRVILRSALLVGLDSHS